MVEYEWLETRCPGICNGAGQYVEMRRGSRSKSVLKKCPTCKGKGTIIIKNKKKNK